MAAGNAKIAGAVVGGYVLGRTKKGRAAIRIALWLSNNKGLVDKVTGNPEAQQLVGQVQGPLREALTKAAMSTATARMGKLSAGLTKRTEALGQVEDLTEGLGGTVSKTGKSVGGAVGKTAKGVTGRLHPKSKRDVETAELPEDDVKGDDVEPAEEPEQTPETTPEQEEPGYQNDPEYQEYLDWKKSREQGDDTEGEDEAGDEEPDEPEKPAPAKKTPAKKAPAKTANGNGGDNGGEDSNESEADDAGNDEEQGDA